MQSRIIYNVLGAANEDLLKRWTKSAVECYKIGCNCSKCDIPKKKEDNGKCQMKPYVLELVRRYGAPK